jgi:hypothetical protein
MGDEWLAVEGEKGLGPTHARAFTTGQDNGTGVWYGIIAVHLYLRRPLKKAHLLRCARSSRSNVLRKSTPPLADSSRAWHLGPF